jgi:hypothetical protein
MTLSKAARAIYLELRHQRQEGDILLPASFVCEYCQCSVPQEEGGLYQVRTDTPFNVIKTLCRDCADGLGAHDLQVHR